MGIPGTRMRGEEGFDSAAAFYELVIGPGHAHKQARGVHAFLASEGFSAEYERIIDLGTATGQFVCELRRHGWVVDGLDASAEMTQRARQECPDAQFWQRRLPNEPLPGQYTTALALDSFVCFLSRRELRGMLKRLQEAGVANVVIDMRNALNADAFPRRGDTVQRENARYALAQTCLATRMVGRRFRARYRYAVYDKWLGQTDTHTRDIAMRFHRVSTVRRMLRHIGAEPLAEGADFLGTPLHANASRYVALWHIGSNV